MKTNKNILKTTPSLTTKKRTNKRAKITTSFNLQQHALFAKLQAEMSKAIIGQQQVITEIIITLFSEGHLLLNGLPGMAKTLIVKSLAKVLGFSYQRIQFTPDLLPLDLLGYELIDKKTLSAKFVEGPIFSQLLLADEINRAPAKTQSALLQAMEEKEVTLLGKTRALPNPFFVLATQNPHEQKGTYELPEAQIDRFMSMINIDYPTAEEELAILERVNLDLNKINAVFKKNEFQTALNSIEKVKVSPEVKEWIVNLVRQTRPENTSAKIVQKYISLGCSPRATKYIFRAAKTLAWFAKSAYIEKNHLITILPMILRHRIILNYTATMENVSIEDILNELIV